MVPTGLKPQDYPYDPAEVSSWTAIYDPDTIDAYLMERNVAHFDQASETPNVESLYAFLGQDALSAAADIILSEGSSQFTDLSSATQQFLDQFKQQLPTVSPSVSSDEVSRGFAKWKERTSASPSNRYLGHYKALLSPDSDDTTGPLGPQLMQIHADFMTLASEQGISLES